MTRLVLVHGRDQGGLDPEALERHWLDALNAGLADIGSTLRLADDDATFVHYGDSLQAADGASPPVTVHAFDAGSPTTHRLSADEARFALAVVREILAAASITPDAQADSGARAVAARPGDVRADGVVDDTLDALALALARALAALDRYVPGLSGAVVLLAVRDVHTYLHDAEVRGAVDAGFLAALPTDEPAVVVAHSLGSVIAYQALRSPAGADLAVPALVTLGSPLAIRAVLDAVAAVAPLGWPAPVDRWVAVRDPRDLLTLHDLTPQTFPLDPPGPGIENAHVVNTVTWHHAAAGVVDGAPAGYAATRPVAAVVDDQLG